MANSHIKNNNNKGQSMAYNFYAGSTFNYAGSLQMTGAVAGGTSGTNSNQPDYSTWVVTAALFDQSGENKVGSITVSNNSLPEYPSTNGLFELNAAASETIKWPIGKAQLNVQAITPQGAVMFADPIWLRIQAMPIASLQGTQGGGQ
ncbi:hypothetical protein P0D69_28025 [Paraburkholderia sediminicola]|uniref:hypothetical protein n=1 Tax=Paraburkholderia sediminicola TaxID=458836 RepID=UPI0038BD37A9